MRFPDDNDKENTKEENINGAECERKQGNDEGRHCKKRRTKEKKEKEGREERKEKIEEKREKGNKRNGGETEEKEGEVRA